jgi:hypothetical protein
MSIRNEMEAVVREEVARVRASGSATRGACWCPVCEADVVALALTLLPPLYCREETTGTSTSLIRAGKITDAVQAALKRVALSPKHPPGVMPTLRREIALVNYAYEVGATMVAAALGRTSKSCCCEDCRTDALAYALNRYPAKYGITQSGRRSLHPTYLDFMRYELGLLVNHAARVVSEHPRH